MNAQALHSIADVVKKERVPLFFFVAGCTERLATSALSFVNYVISKFKGIMIPYFLFSIVALMLFTIIGQGSHQQVLLMLRQAFWGVRNHHFAIALWFLPCLFIVLVFFNAIKRLLKFPLLLLLASNVLLLIAEHWLPNRPLMEPRAFWNVDLALYYIFYFALGYLAFPIFQKLFTAENKPKVIRSLLLFVSATFSYTIFMGKKPFMLNIAMGTTLEPIVSAL